MPRLKRERLYKKNFVGKTIERIDDSFPGAVRISFTDHSSVILYIYPPPNPPPTINTKYFPSREEVPIKPIRKRK